MLRRWRRAEQLVCEAYAEWRSAHAVIRKKGSSYETKTVGGGISVRIRPEVKITADAWRRVRQGLTDFGSLGWAEEAQRYGGCQRIQGCGQLRSSRKAPAIAPAAQMLTSP